MRRLFVAAGILLVIVLAGLGSGSSRSVTAITATYVVDDNFQDCTTQGGGSSFDNIYAAVNIATTGQTIFVCPGVYPEPPLIINDANVTLIGPSATDEIDGMATVQVEAPAVVGESQMVRIAADGVSVLGLDFDGTLPPNYDIGMVPVGGIGAGLIVADNTFHDLAPNVTSVAIGSIGPAFGENVQIRRNHSIATAATPTASATTPSSKATLLNRAALTHRPPGSTATTTSSRAIPWVDTSASGATTGQSTRTPSTATVRSRRWSGLTVWATSCLTTSSRIPSQRASN